METIKAPFTPEQVENLNKYQNETPFHPFTCGSPEIPGCKRREASIKRVAGETVEFSNENEGVLIASEEGFVCPCGGYRQEWAFRFMAENLKNE